MTATDGTLRAGDRVMILNPGLGPRRARVQQIDPAFWLAPYGVVRDGHTEVEWFTRAEVCPLRPSADVAVHP